MSRTTCLEDIKSDRKSDQPYSRGYSIGDKNDIRPKDSQESFTHNSYPDNSPNSATENQSEGDVCDREETSSVYQTATEDLTSNEIDSDCVRDEAAKDLVSTHAPVIETETDSILNRSGSIYFDSQPNESSFEARPQLRKPFGKHLRQNRYENPKLERHQDEGVMSRLQQEATRTQTESSSETEFSTLSTRPQTRPLGLEIMPRESLEGSHKMEELAVSTSSLDTSSLSLIDSSGEVVAASEDQIELPFMTPRKKQANAPSLTLPCELPGNLKTSDRPSALAPWGKVAPVKPSPNKQTRNIFDKSKDTFAKDFLSELDAKITKGEIARMTQLTGGVKVIWTKSLNTTAGRANWRQETGQSRLVDGAAKLEQRHHASIELAEKVINDESKLLNVVAHEFCHLANFMISGVNNRPHGSEFQAWAAKCSRAFGKSHGIHVTTRHTYEIDFRFVWRCTSCDYEYKRHSRSINPGRHGCGNCKGILKQIKPVPRVAKGGATGNRVGKPNQYQTFVKQHMKTVRKENPGSPQKDLMKMVAERWALDKKRAKIESIAKSDKEDVGGVVDQMEQLTLNQ
ncbi:hypothetical protein CDD81_5430 [Ophiocordyceps australis]|uniref:SprT-like domain-containing protein n=1 Tax=Ophiocordyceps australis TaxID=1399860 RepID=A0A2C5XV11_9HYPO|nr:hypothetical protein CDD81_5430 [Ophiocordyceps australis]